MLTKYNYSSDVTVRDPLAAPLDHSSTAVTLRVAIARIYRALRQHAASEITPSQVSVLFRIEESEPVRMGVLAHLERITPATLSRVVDSLESLKLIEREPEPVDKRVTLLKVSAAGRRMIAAQRRASTQALAEALARLPESDRTALLDSAPALARLAEIMLASPENS